MAQKYLRVPIQQQQPIFTTVGILFQDISIITPLMLYLGPVNQQHDTTETKQCILLLNVSFVLLIRK